MINLKNKRYKLMGTSRNERLVMFENDQFLVFNVWTGKEY